MAALPRISKAAVIEALIASVRADLASVTEAQRRTVEGATHEESRPENDKDTRALESTYLARGLAQRVDELKVVLARISPLPRDGHPADTPAGAGCVIVVKDDERELTRYLLAPAAGGARVEVEGQRFLVVTREAPVGRALWGRRTGDDVLLKTPKGERELLVVDVY